MASQLAKRSFASSTAVVGLLTLCAACEEGSGREAGAEQADIAVTREALTGPEDLTVPFNTDNQAAVRVETGGTRCSGTVIGPRAVLTAAHCGGDTGASVHYRTADGVFDSVLSSECTPHPDAYTFNPNATTCMLDMACVEITSSFDFEVLTLEEAIPVTPRLSPPKSCFEQDPADEHHTLPLPFVQRGYANTSPPVLSELALDARLQWNPLDPQRGYVPAASEVVLTPPPGFSIQNGDSGGGTFEPGPQGPVVAAFSCLSNRNGGFLWRMTGANKPPIEWLVETIDPEGNCRLGATPGACTLGGYDEPLSDDDGDGLPDIIDLCPHAAPDSACGWNHCDSDGDYVGDECDACPGDGALHPELGTCDHKDSDGDGQPDGCDMCPFGRLGSGSTTSDPDNDTIPDACDACPDVASNGDCGLYHCDGDEDGVGDECDNCPDAANPLQENCNRDVELKLSGGESLGLGDACDPTPCGETEVDSKSTNLVPGTLGGGWAPFVSIDARHGVDLEDQPNDSNLRTGLRFCTCTAASEDSIAVRQTCEVAQADMTGNCTIGANSVYASGSVAEDPIWKNVTLDTSRLPAGDVISVGVTKEIVREYEKYQGSFEPDLVAQWSAVADHTRWQSIDPSLPPFGGLDDMNGVMWTRTPAQSDGTPLSNPASSHYWSGAVEAPGSLPIVHACMVEPFVAVVADFARCPGPACVSTFPRPYVGITGVAAGPGICARPASCLLSQPRINWGPQTFSNASFASPQVRDAILSGLCQSGRRWLGPSEAERWLRDPRFVNPSVVNPEVVLVSIRDDATLAGPVIKRVGEGQYTVDTLTVPSTPAKCVEPRADHLAVMSALRDQLWVGGGFDGAGAPLRDLCALNLQSQTWRELQLPAAARPEHVLAAAYSPVDDALYVVDKTRLLGTAPDPSCASGASQGVSYWSCADSVDWNQAHSRCNDVGMELVEIGDAAENAFVRPLLPADAWIGATDVEVEGEWTSVRGQPLWSGGPSGTAHGYVNWALGQPNNLGLGGQDCARMRAVDGSWLDENCALAAPYVCAGEFPPDPGEAFAQVESQATSALSCGGAQGLQWPMRGGCHDRLGLSDFVGPQADTLQWSSSLGLPVKSSPAIGADGTIYVGSAANNLYAVKPDGSVKWLRVTGGDVDSSPALSPDGSVYVGSDDNKLYALDAATGALRWTFTTGDDVDSTPAVGGDGTVYVGSDDNKLYAIGANGAPLWSYTTLGDVDSSPALGPDGTVYIGSDDDYLYALRPDAGLTPAQRLIWKKHLGLDVDVTPLVTSDGFVYVGSDAAKLYKLAASNGNVVWSFNALLPVDASPALLPDRAVVFGSDAGKVWALEPGGGVRWSRQLAGPINSSPVVGADGTVYVGSDDNNVHALRASDGAILWSRYTGADVQSSPAIGENGVLYVGSDIGALLAIGAPDEPSLSPEKVRLLRIAALGGTAEVVRTWVRRSSNDRYALAVDDAGDLFIAASRDHFGWHYVLHLQRQSDRDMLVAGFQIGAGPLLDKLIQADRHGASVPTVRGDGTAAVAGYATNAMTTVGLAEATPRIF